MTLLSMPTASIIPAEARDWRVAVARDALSGSYGARYDGFVTILVLMQILSIASGHVFLRHGLFH